MRENYRTLRRLRKLWKALISYKRDCQDGLIVKMAILTIITIQPSNNYFLLC